MTDLTTAPIASDVESGDITMLVRTVNGVDTLYQVPASVIQGQTGPTGPTGVTGPTGPQGTRGSLWYFGSGSPATSLTPNDDDMYYDTASGDVYNYASSRWSVVGNIKGPTGSRGTAGTTWYFGKGAPIIATAASGDIYLDESSGNLFQYSGTSWTQTTANIIGPQGIQGPTGSQGTRGSQWFTGSGTPVISSALNDDMYLDTSTSNVFQYNNSVWSKVGNIRGAVGNVGSQWYSGSGAPVASSSYETNDFYINELTSDVYQYNGSAWTKIINIQGAVGPQGTTGPAGPQGIQGSVWHYGNVSPPTITTDVNSTDMYLDGILGNVYQYLSSTWVKSGNIRGPQGTFTNDGSDSILIDGLTTFNSGSLKFMSDGDNTTIDSSIVPSGGTSGTPYQGNININAKTITYSGSIVVNGNITSTGSSSFDNGALTTNGSGSVTMSGSLNGLDIKNDLGSTIISRSGDGYYHSWSTLFDIYNNNGTFVQGSGNVMSWNCYGGGFVFRNSGVNGDTESKILSTTNSTTNFYQPIIANYTLTVTGESSFDNGKILTDGSGNVTISGNTSFGSTSSAISTVDVYGQSITGPNTSQRNQFGNKAVLNSIVTPGATDYSANPYNIFVVGVNTLTLRWNTTNQSLQWYDVNRNEITTETFYDGGQNFKVYGRTLTNGLTSTSTSSLDSGKIITDGNGKITTSGIIVAATPTDVPGTTSTNVATTKWVDTNYMSFKNGGTINGNLIVDGVTSLDTGKISTDGVGNLSMNGTLTIGKNNGTNIGVELGDQVSGKSTTAYIDFHSSGSSNDYDTRIESTGGTSGTIGQGAFSIDSKQINLNATTIINGPGTVTGGLTVSNTSTFNAPIVLKSSDLKNQITMYVDTTGNGVSNPDYVIDVGSEYFIFENNGNLQIPGTLLGTAQYTNYGDLAERYTSKENYVPGTFVKISDNENYEIEEAIDGDYLFGVISTNPGLLLNHTIDGLPVALTGRVPAKIIGPVKKGQPITVSDISGVGIVGDKMVIGFALETNLSSDIKLVEIAIGGRA